ncbi:PREDICTED: protein ripply1 isoform X1 [Ceratotherium simum simum]|uniref:Protein ripply1 isoform X1 n=1 Tax=Ceratotherium simum simum TaxID=73337 RepID=A0ABM1DGB4_CERSS|nr:PREDICTED: protein ripply1 isoform X1 [Ceratotherium simum simum]
MASEPSFLEASFVVSGSPRSSPFFLHRLISPLCPRGACLWRPWLSPTNDPPRQAAGGATGAEVTKADSEFHHPVRLFWPKSRSYDYLYTDGEILLQHFPVQATINLYEDSDSEEEEEEEEEHKEEEKKEEADEKGPEGCVRVPGSAPHRATAHLTSPPLTCPN